MELRLSFSQQLADGLRGGGHQLTDLYVNAIAKLLFILKKSETLLASIYMLYVLFFNCIIHVD